MKSLVKREKGFTLIEIVIVLAIAAGLILIVLLAVSGAQKGNRDTKRANAAGDIASYLEQYAANNNGSVATATPSSANVPAGNNPSTGAFPTVGTGAQAAAAAPEQMYVQLAAKCSGTAAVAGTNANYAILYYQEGGGGGAQCKDNAK